MQIKFDATKDRSLQQEIRKSISQYFKDRNISPNGDYRMVVKTIALFTIFFVPYFLILFGGLPTWAMWLLTVMMGVGVAGIGMGVMHDACHNSYSSNPTVNKILSYTINLIGGNRFNWINQHNVKHHTYTNVYGIDEDLEGGSLIRLSPYAKHRWFHRFQHIYAGILYFLGTTGWVTYKDWRQFFDSYREKEKHPKVNFTKEFLILLGSKLFLYAYLIVIPYLVLDLSFWAVLVGFFTIIFTSGFILTLTFQMAHVVENTSHYESEPQQDIPDSWFVHQIKTTSDFARNSSLLNWYLGGLNFQVEHHLFPNICHVHYRELSKIVKDKVESYGMRYNEFPTFRKAIVSHFKMLKKYSSPTEVAEPQMA